MRSSFSHCVLFSVIVSCGGQASPNAAVPAASAAPVAVVTAEPVQNSTQLRVDRLDSPLSAARVSFAAPEPGEHLLNADPRSYRVRVVSAAVGPEIIGLELSLDAGRPRSVSLAEPTITLGELLSEDATLATGAHWLFVAPVLASGLVPRSVSGGPRAAKARRFFIGKTPDEAAGPSGALWLRKPEGSYNGPKRSESVLFDAFVFSALGAELEAPCTISLRSPAVSGQLSVSSPFAVHEVPSGVYEVKVSAAVASTSTAHFTVNRELAGGQ